MSRPSTGVAPRVARLSVPTQMSHAHGTRVVPHVVTPAARRSCTPMGPGWCRMELTTGVSPTVSRLSSCTVVHIWWWCRMELSTGVSPTVSRLSSRTTQSPHRIFRPVHRSLTYSMGCFLTGVVYGHEPRALTDNVSANPQLCGGGRLE